MLALNILLSLNSTNVSLLLSTNLDTYEEMGNQELAGL